MLRDGDVLVVAGKGHEQGQIVGGVIHPVRRRRPRRAALALEAVRWLSRSGPRDEIAAATGGRAAGPAFAATGVSIDTRTLEPGDLFVALAGERDGHDFVAAALAKGAAGVLASAAGRRPGDHRRRTPSTALEALGERRPGPRRSRAARRGHRLGRQDQRHPGDRAPAWRLAGPAHGSVKSYNNHIGVPLTLARMPRDTERAVFEIGMNHADEIAPAVADGRARTPWSSPPSARCTSRTSPTARPASPGPRPRSSRA